MLKHLRFSRKLGTTAGYVGDFSPTREGMSERFGYRSLDSTIEFKCKPFILVGDPLSTRLMKLRTFLVPSFYVAGQQSRFGKMQPMWSLVYPGPPENLVVD